MGAFSGALHGGNMNRRQVLVAGGFAAVSAVAMAKDPVPVIPGGYGGSPSTGAVAEPCALLPIEAGRRGNPVYSLRIGQFWPSETASGLARMSFDFQVFDEANLPRWVYAWQLDRRASGLALPSSGLRMNFEFGTRLDLMVTITGRSGKIRNFNAGLPGRSMMVLATERQYTGLPPRLADLRYVAGSESLYLADGSPRDFDAMLLHTS